MKWHEIQNISSFKLYNIYLLKDKKKTQIYIYINNFKQSKKMF